METQRAWYVAEMKKADVGLYECGRDVQGTPYANRFSFYRGQLVTFQMQEDGTVLVRGYGDDAPAVMTIAWAQDRLHARRTNGRAVEYANGEAR
jgi:hypothetical protein